MVIGYALAFWATRTNIHGHAMTAIDVYFSSSAVSEAEAIGEGVLLAYQRWPIERGWHSHGCVTGALRPEHIRPEYRARLEDK